MMCGTDPYPKDYKAKKYKLEKHSLRKEDFVHLMKNLPVHVDDEEIEEMFAYADRNQDGHLSYSEFQVMVNPPPAPKVPKPHIADIGLPPQVFHIPVFCFISISDVYQCFCIDFDAFYFWCLFLMQVFSPSPSALKPSLVASPLLPTPRPSLPSSRRASFSSISSMVKLQNFSGEEHSLE